MRTTLAKYKQQVQQANAELQHLGVSLEIELDETPAPCISGTDVAELYDRIIQDGPIAAVSRSLYIDGHYQEAVTRAYICLEGLVRSKSKSKHSGVSLMRTVFSKDSPLLKLNRGISQSEKDEQQGYMDMFAGAMAGIRNPRSHDHDVVDTKESALELLMFAHHLSKKIVKSVKTRKRK